MIEEVTEGSHILGRLDAAPLGSHGEKKLCELANRIHHTLGHARRAAGIKHVDAFGILRAAGQRLMSAYGPIVINRTLQQRLGTVINLHEEFNFWQTLANFPNAHGVAGLKKHCFSIAVVEQINQFVRLVAVIYVYRAAANLENTELSFLVFTAVVQVQTSLGIWSQTVLFEQAGNTRCSTLKPLPT